MNHSVKAIEQLINELQSITETINQSATILAIDKDLLKQKCIQLYDAIHTLELHIPAIVVAEHNPIQQPETIVAIAAEKQIETEPERLPLETLLETATLFDLPAIEKSDTELQNELIDFIIEQKKEEEELPTVMPIEEIQEISLHEKISISIPTKPNLSEKFSEQIGNLKAAINVNLKIALVNNLFGENTVDYVKAIDKLNTYNTLNEALLYFAELKHHYDWENENPLVKELEELVHKRY